MVYNLYPPNAVTPQDIALLRHRGFKIEFPSDVPPVPKLLTRQFRKQNHLCFKCGKPAQYYPERCHHGIYCKKHARENKIKARELRERKQ